LKKESFSKRISKKNFSKEFVVIEKLPSNDLKKKIFLLNQYCAKTLFENCFRISFAQFETFLKKIFLNFKFIQPEEKILLPFSNSRKSSKLRSPSNSLFRILKSDIQFALMQDFNNKSIQFFSLIS